MASARGYFERHAHLFVYCFDLLQFTRICFTTQVAYSTFSRLSYVVAYTVEKFLHRRRVVRLYHLSQMFERVGSPAQMLGSTGVGKNFTKQIIGFAHKASCYGEMSLESGARRRLVLHCRTKDERRGKGY